MKVSECEQATEIQWRLGTVGFRVTGWQSFITTAKVRDKFLIDIMKIVAPFN